MISFTWNIFFSFSGRLIYTCTCSSGLAAEEHLISTNFSQDSNCACLGNPARGWNNLNWDHTVFFPLEDLKLPFYLNFYDKKSQSGSKEVFMDVLHCLTKWEMSLLENLNEEKCLLVFISSDPVKTINYNQRFESDDRDRIATILDWFHNLL